MKKTFFTLLLAFSLLCSGCGEDLNNTPTKQVEMFFMNYQTLDQEVISDLNDTLNSDTTMNSSQKEEYKEIMKKHYKNLIYDVKDEIINGDTATVQVEIEVYDYSKINKAVNKYLEDNPTEFLDEDNNYDQEKFIDYKLSELKKAKEKVKYTLDLSLTKSNDKWQMDQISSITEDKILGIYEY